MAGVGPPPKDPNKRARRNAGPTPLRIIPATPVEQPPLPEFDLEVTVDGEIKAQRFKWPPRTVEWWQMWKDSPLSTEFTSTDWSELLDTAVLHARYWSGDVKVAAELRLRVAKFGATPEDRARLRIQFAAANEADKKASQSGDKPAGGSKNRYGPLGA
ncbi:Bacteriophage protein [Mycobacteroides abscessus subsp. bolletii]|uniref:phage terminase small subunit n=1 Tax=Mycobacteroides abscessus TaxID=36809 RepID=UPI0009A5ED96|nr:hypothetical protein [Mycobacteroides abscessus]SKR94524.1 Bacteriophage protein [Mycobacteroides abscessus subsp. bolletii]SKS02990.1 Bacteriophage protein [Mycobacteroides abscessus subsp. bolletii]DAZ90140.1 TPA_asm: terminase, small subunit [Mycobacterium phage prophiFVLQ01-1]